ncbi:hypothetical protein BGZ65_004956, partial [Modicella reniformis]
MTTTQSFCLIGETAIEDIPCDHVDGKYVVHWVDIEQVFPGVKHVKNGNITINLMKDSDRNRVVPYCIEHHPDAILNVVGSTIVKNSPIETTRDLTATSGHIDIPTRTLTKDRTIEGPQVSSLQTDSSISEINIKTSEAKLSFKQVVNRWQRKTLELEIEQRLISSLPAEVQEQLQLSSNGHISVLQALKNGQVEQSEMFMKCFQELKVEMAKNNDLAAENNELAANNNELATKSNELAAKNTEMATCMIKLQEAFNIKQEALNVMQAAFEVKQEEMKQLQIQALSQLSLLQNRVQAVLTQTYELHEYPIPRLFVVLPQYDSAWDFKSPFSNKFRLYFLCECGEHTKSINSKIPHHIHLAKHEGYEIARPSEFFNQYGSYVLTILKMLKF